ncbi:hypothetical protein BJF92_00655 [Rhizobium rhizosphaerae]|uniref:Uncharacterized protein n=1 Tax=Xaviernesmea rhizosphaerae TaxID=1672749 RepID=A0A1Q9AEJ6_9HYPH|nr:hypothetical protein [Xaviernesmea rhizosphaerae]OLP53311.1 hypothetical protein BJF92_00655 [Xaviernesmea rhizosphaerae]
MAKKRKSKGKNISLGVTDDEIDRGTGETRRRLTPDPLMSDSLHAHRIPAGMRIRTALEEGIGCKALDMVRIGMTSGASSGITQPTPLDRLLVERTWLDRWRNACDHKCLHHAFAEEFAIGHSLRQIAERHVLSRHKVSQLVYDGLDLYAELRGFLPKPNGSKASIRVLENPNFVAPPAADDHEPAPWKLPVKARLRNRNLTN